MKIVSADFLTGAVSPKQWPPGSWPEFAFAGRSNVGKSSLIRSLLNRKKLVRTSSTPGKTQEINFFKVNGELIFADLPGYGFAKVPPSVQKKWRKMIEQYLLQRESLRAVIFIVDIRRKPTQLDLDLKEWLEAVGVRYILAATKSDKLSRSEIRKQTETVRSAFSGEGMKGFVVYSCKNNTGRRELWSRILELAQNRVAVEEEAG